jgi:N-acetylneuraminic acid mutarotase
MPTARGSISANAVNGQIYVTGGLEMTRLLYVEESNKTEAYDPTTDTWTTKAEMPYAVRAHSSIVLGDKIYVLTSPIQIYDTKTDSWSLGSFPPTAQSNADAVTILDERGRELIYIFGGGEQTTYLGLVQIYDPQSDVWGVGSPMPTPRNGLAVVVVNNQIYALGGTTHSSGDGALGTLVSANERYTPSESDSALPIPTPTPTSSPIPETEPFPTTLVMASAITASVIGIGLFQETQTLNAAWVNTLCFYVLIVKNTKFMKKYD